MASTKPRAIFGAPLESHQFVLDQGCMVPRVLVSLKRRFEVLNGFHTEGVFRVAGNDGECLKIAKEIGKGKDAYTERSSNVHNYATLIKRFFAELPKKILAPIPTDELLKHKLDFSKLDPTLWVDAVSMSVYQWLLTVLFNVLHFSSENKMNVSNLAIVWAPVLFDTGMSTTDLARGITVAEAQRLFIEHHLNKELEISDDERAVMLVDRAVQATTSPRMAALLQPSHAEGKGSAASSPKKKSSHQRKHSIGSGITKKLKGSHSPGNLDIVLDDMQSQDMFYKQRVMSQMFTHESARDIDAMALSPRGHTSTSVAVSSIPTVIDDVTYQRTKSAESPLRRNKRISSPSRLNRRLSKTLSDKSLKRLLSPQMDTSDDSLCVIGTREGTGTKVGFSFPEEQSDGDDIERSDSDSSAALKKEKGKEKKRAKEKKKKESKKKKKEKLDSPGHSTSPAEAAPEHGLRQAFRGLLKGSSPSTV